MFISLQRLLKRTPGIPHTLSVCLCPGLIDLGESCDIRTGLDWYNLGIYTGKYHKPYSAVILYILTEEKEPKRWDLWQYREQVDMIMATIKRNYKWKRKRN